MINKDRTYAIVGASADTSKYGYKVFEDLLESGHKAIPINPKGGELLGEKVYLSVLQYPEKIDVAVFVVPPQVTIKVLDDVAIKGIKTVWMQPGSESMQAIAKCNDIGAKCVSKACIMVQRQSDGEHKLLKGKE